MAALDRLEGRFERFERHIVDGFAAVHMHARLGQIEALLREMSGKARHGGIVTMGELQAWMGLVCIMIMASVVILLQYG